MENTKFSSKFRKARAMLTSWHDAVMFCRNSFPLCRHRLSAPSSTFLSLVYFLMPFDFSMKFTIMDKTVHGVSLQKFQDMLRMTFRHTFTYL
jgi:hypothetical protein